MEGYTSSDDGAEDLQYVSQALPSLQTAPFSENMKGGHSQLSQSPHVSFPLSPVATQSPEGLHTSPSGHSGGGAHGGAAA